MKGHVPIQKIKNKKYQNNHIATITTINADQFTKTIEEPQIKSQQLLPGKKAYEYFMSSGGSENGQLLLKGTFLKRQSASRGDWKMTVGKH